MSDDLKRVGLVFKADGTTDFAKSLSQINTLTKENYSAFKLAKSQYDENTSAVTKLKDAQKYLTETTDAYRMKCTVLSEQLEELENAEKRDEKAISKKKVELNNAKTALNNYEKSLNDVNAKLESGSAELKEYAEKVEEFSKKASDAGETLTKNVTAPIIAVGTASTVMADEVQTAVNKYLSATGTAATETEKFRDIIEGIYENNYGEGFEDIADALSEVRTQIGSVVDSWDSAALQEFTESAIALRDTFEFDIKESVRSANMMMETFGMDGLEAMNMIAEGAQNGLNKNEDLLDVVNEYSVHFDKLGLDAYDMFKVLENGADNGAFSIDKVGDAVKEMSIRVIDGSNTTKEGFEAINLNAEEMSKKFSQGGETAKEAFMETVKALASMEDPLQQNIAGTNLFGTMWEDLGPTVVTSLADIEENAYGASDALNEIKKIKYDDIKNKVSKLGKAFTTNFAVPLGEVILPIISEIIDIITNWIGSFGELSTTMKVIIGVIGTVVASIGPLLVIIGTIGAQVSNAIGFFAKFKLALYGGAEGAGGLAGALSSLTGPMIAVIAVIGLVIAAVIDLWNTSEEFRTNIMGIVNNIMSIIQNLYNSVIKPILIVIMQLLKDIWENSLKPLWEQFKSFIASIISLISSFMSIATPIINTLVKLLGTILTPAVKAIGSVFSSIFSGVIKVIKSFLSTATTIFNNVSTLFKNLKSALTNPIESAKNTISGIIKKIKGLFSFKITWPKIPMPHFGISPKGWGIGDLLKGKIPKLSIDWYAKAMNKGVIFNSPTAFGVNDNGEIMAGGEAGSETLVGTNSLMNMIKNAVSSNNQAVIERLDTLISLTSAFFQEALARMEKDIVLEDGTIVGKMASSIDAELGNISRLKARGI